jgi:peptide/nickel transport system permease protein
MTRGPVMERLARLLDSDFVFSFSRSPAAMAAAAVTLILFAGALGAPWLAPNDPMDLSSLSLADSFKPPLGMDGAAWSTPLGTDNQGRCVLSAIMYGLRISVLVSAASVLFAVLIGAAVGLIAGYWGGVAGAVLMRIAEIQLTFPAILTALLSGGIIEAALPRAWSEQLRLPVIVFAIGISLWPGFARTIRGSTLVERDKDYVLAARVIGVPAWRILLGHVLPNVIGPALVIGTLALGAAVIAEATLSFLGVGLPPTEPSLGTLIRLGNNFLFSGKWWVVIFPGIVLVVTVLAINVLGDWLRDVLNPRLR